MLIEPLMKEFMLLVVYNDEFENPDVINSNIFGGCGFSGIASKEKFGEFQKFSSSKKLQEE